MNINIAQKTATREEMFPGWEGQGWEINYSENPATLKEGAKILLKWPSQACWKSPIQPTFSVVFMPLKGRIILLDEICCGPHLRIYLYNT